MDDQDGPIEEDGFIWEGTRAELEAWKAYKKRKVLAFVERGYSVSWYPDADGWIEVYTPERHQVDAPEIRAHVKFFGRPSEYGIDGGMISKLAITSTTTNLMAQALGRTFEKTRVLYNYDRGPDVDHLQRSPQAKKLYHIILEELN